MLKTEIWAPFFHFSLYIPYMYQLLNSWRTIGICLNHHEKAETYQYFSAGHKERLTWLLTKLFGITAMHWYIYFIFFLLNITQISPSPIPNLEIIHHYARLFCTAKQTHIQGSNPRYHLRSKDITVALSVIVNRTFTRFKYLPKKF